MNPSIGIRFEAALDQKEYVGLNQFVNDLKAEGLSQVEIYDCFDQFREKIRAQGREKDEDRIMDVMDFIVGWCSPHERLFSTYLTQEEIDNYRQSKLR